MFAINAVLRYKTFSDVCGHKTGLEIVLIVKIFETSNHRNVVNPMP